MPFAAGCSGVQMTGWFRKEIKGPADLKGLNMRIPGLVVRIYAALGVEVRQLPGGEIFPALERGVIDAAEFVGPFPDARPGMQNAAKNYYASGWHEPSTVSEIVMQRKIWDALPTELRRIVRAAADATNLKSLFLLEAPNADALDPLLNRDKLTVRQLPDEVVNALRKTTTDVLNDAAGKDAMTKKCTTRSSPSRKSTTRGSEISYQHYSARTKLWIKFFTAVLVMLPFSLFVVWLGCDFAASSWSLAEISPNPGGLPLRRAVESLVVSDYALLAITAVSIIVRTGAQLVGRGPVPKVPEASHGT